MSNKKLIVLEGLPGSGKTKLFRRSKKHFRQILHIPELTTPVQPLSDVSADNSFMKNDEKKYDLFAQADRDCVMDRGYASTLCWGYVLITKGMDNNYPERLEWFNDNVNKTLFRPAAYIFLDIVPELSLKRTTLPLGKNLAWSTEADLVTAREFYKNFFSILEPTIPKFILDGSSDANDIFAQFSKIIHKMLYV